LKDYYEQKICTLAERVIFTQRHRKDTENITQYLNALRALAGNCGFGANLNERLRDQLVIGINNEQWQKELFRLHPRDDATLADVSASALLLEQASTQQQRLHHLTKGGNSGSADVPVRRVTSSKSYKPSKHYQHQFKQQKQSSTSASAKSDSARQQHLTKGKNCYRCGRRVHAAGENCPADGTTCSACGKANHFARVCVSSGNATFPGSTTSGSGRRRRLHNIGAADSEEYSYESTDDDSEYSCDDINMLAAVADKGQGQGQQQMGRFAMLHAVINGRRLRMLYDPGAVLSVISRKTWQKIGSPPLSPATELLAYTKLPLTVLGQASVQVTAFGENRKLPVSVIDADDMPLFGIDWCMAFNLPLPEGVHICALKKTSATNPSVPSTVPTSVTSSQLQQLLEEYDDVFQPGQGTIRGQEAVVNISPDARPTAFPPRSVPFPLRKAVEAELDRLVGTGVLEPVDPRVTPIEWASPIVIAAKRNGAIRILAISR
jgi:hypothetical protein